MNNFKIYTRFTWHINYVTKSLQFSCLIGEKFNHEEFILIYSCNFKLLPTHTVCKGIFSLLYCTLKSFEMCFVGSAYLFFYLAKSCALSLHNYVILHIMKMPIFLDGFVILMIIYFLQDQCIAKLESLGFRIGQSLVERYFPIYILTSFQNHIS